MQGKHNLKAGVEVQLQRLNNGQVTGQTYSFAQGFTQGPDPTRATANGGYGYATFLLGIGGATVNFAPAVAEQILYYAGYLQDSYRVTPKLTLNLGVRYEYQAPRTDRYNQLTNFDFYGRRAAAGSRTESARRADLSRSGRSASRADQSRPQ